MAPGLAALKEVSEVRQLDTHRANVWSKIAEDHRHLNSFSEKISGFLKAAQMEDKQRGPLLQAVSIKGHSLSARRHSNRKK